MSKIQRQGVKNDVAIVAGGGTIDDLINDDQIYVAADSINKTLKDAITDGDIGGGGSTTLAGLTDTTITAPANGEFLKYNGAAWINAPGFSPNAEYFSIFRSTGQAVGVAGITKVNFNSIEFDSHSGWNGGTFTYTVQNTGKFLLFFNVRLDSFITNEVVTARVNINGTLRAAGVNSIASSFPTTIAPRFLDLVAGQTIEFFVQNSVDASFTISGNANGTTTSAFIMQVIE